MIKSVILDIFFNRIRIGKSIQQLGSLLFVFANNHSAVFFVPKSLKRQTGAKLTVILFYFSYRPPLIASVMFCRTLFLFCQLINLSRLCGAVTAHKSQFFSVNGVGISSVSKRTLIRYLLIPLPRISSVLPPNIHIL